MSQNLWLIIFIGVDIDKANPDGSINLSLPNVFGRGEMLSLKCKYDSYESLVMSHKLWRHFSGSWISKVWKVTWCVTKHSSWFLKNIFGSTDKSVSTIEAWLRRKRMVQCLWRTNGCRLHTCLRIFTQFYIKINW